MTLPQKTLPFAALTKQRQKFILSSLAVLPYLTGPGSKLEELLIKYGEIVRFDDAYLPGMSISIQSWKTILIHLSLEI